MGEHKHIHDMKSVLCEDVNAVVNPNDDGTCPYCGDDVEE